jgi:[ribosomal protein S5]-alanine N-acetyltransferase
MLDLKNKKLSGDQIHLRLLSEYDAEDMLNLQIENRAFFEQYSMERSDSFYTLEEQQNRIKSLVEGSETDQDYYFGVFKNEDNQLIGTINLFSVMRGSIQSAFLGYFLDEKHNGRGFTTEAVKLIVDFAFSELKLHRVEAGVMPHNLGSIRVLEKAGFEKEGLARKNVKINGKWEDHVLLGIINPND